MNYILAFVVSFLPVFIALSFMFNFKNIAKGLWIYRNNPGVFKSLRIVFSCYGMNQHNYTSAAMEGKAPNKKQIEDGVQGFYDYAKMYCKRCNHIYGNLKK